MQRDLTTISFIKRGLGLFMPVQLRPGLLRGLFGMVVCGAAFAFTYRSLGNGGIFFVTALMSIFLGLFLGGAPGLIVGMAFNIPIYALLYFPVPPQSADFGTLLVALVVYLGIIPGLYVALGFLLKRFIGVLVAALVPAPAYVTFLVAFPLALFPSPANSGATGVFMAFGMAFGMVWGIGGLSKGASAHEGPTYIAKLNAPPARKPVREARELATKLIPQALALFVPMIRPILTVVGVGVLLVGALLFVASNPIVPVAKQQTYQVAAATNAVTGDKLLLFVVVAVVILGAVVSLAVGLLLLINFLNQQVNKAKEDKPEPVATEKIKAFNIVNFFITWIGDIMNGLRRSMTQ